MISWRNPAKLAFVAAFLAGTNIMVNPVSAEDTIKIEVFHPGDHLAPVNNTVPRNTVSPPPLAETHVNAETRPQNPLLVKPFGQYLRVLRMNVNDSLANFV